MTRSLPKGWRRVRLGEVLEQVTRFEPVKPDGEYRLLGVRWYANGCHLHTETSGQTLRTKMLSVVRAGDITYNKMWTSKGAFGVVQPDHNGFAATMEYPLFAARDGMLSPDFLGHVFRQPKFWATARALCKGTTQRARLNPNDFLRLEIELPPLQEQGKISSALSAMDKAIRANKEVIARTWELKKGMTHEFLSRGLPGRHSRFKDSAFGKIPAEWDTSTVGEVGKVQLGRQRSPAHRTGKYTKPYLRVANVFDGYIDYGDVLTMDFDERDFKKYCLYPGDILLNEGQSRELVGRSAMFDGQPETYCFQNTLIRFRSGDKVVPAFAQLYFQNCLRKGVFAEISKQTTSIAHLGADRFSNLPFPLPRIKEQREIARLLDVLATSLREQELGLSRWIKTQSAVLSYLLSWKE